MANRSLPEARPWLELGQFPPAGPDPHFEKLYFTALSAWRRARTSWRLMMLGWFDRLSIARKLFSAAGSMMVLLVAASLVSLVNSYSAQDMVTHLAARGHHRAAATRIAGDVSVARMQVWRALATGDERIWSEVDRPLVVRPHKYPIFNRRASPPAFCAGDDCLIATIRTRCPDYRT